MANPMNRLRIRMTALAATLWFLPVCANDDTGGNPSDAGSADLGIDFGVGSYDGGGSATGGQFCRDLADIACEGNVECCPNPDERADSVAECIAAITPECEQLFGGVAFDDGRVRVDQQELSVFVERLRSARQTCAVPDDLDLTNPFVGTLGEGADCSPEGDDYSPGLACAPPYGCIYMTSGNSSDAGELTGVCQRPASSGERCDELFCDDALYCDDELTCQPELADGQPCEGGWECRSGECDGVCVAYSTDAFWCDIGL